MGTTLTHKDRRIKFGIKNILHDSHNPFFMKYLCISALLLSTFLAHGQQTFENVSDSISYAIGFDIGRNVQKAGVDLNSEWINRGMVEAFSQDTSQYFSQSEIQSLIQEWQRMGKEKFMKEREELAGKNLAEGKAFLVENGQKDNIQTTSSGLQYEVLEAGSGIAPADTSKVKVHYKGSLLNGEVFDSSYERGDPTVFVVNRVIQGWQEALQLMQPGSKYRLFIPSNLGYGENGTPNGEIPPNSVLVFEVELLEVM